MKVLWITTFPPRRCGIGDHAADFASYLTRKHGIILRVLTYPDGRARALAREDGIQVSRTLRRLRAARLIAREIESFGPDLVHFQSSSFLHPGAVNRGIAAAWRIPVVTTVHDTPASWRLFYAISSLRKVYRKSARLLVHSRDVSDLLVFFHGVDRGRIESIPLGVDLEKYSPRAPSQESLRRYRLDGTRTVLFHGFLRPGKGLETLLKAWAAIEASCPDSLLVVSGDAATQARRYDLLLRSEVRYPERVREFAADLDIAKRIRFTGHVPESLVPGLLASADVVVLPYDGGVAQSASLHKALASGRAIVASDVSGFRDLLVHPKCGVLVPPRDPDALGGAILGLLEDPRRARELGDRARQRAEQSLSWAVVASRTLEVYKDLMATSPLDREETKANTSNPHNDELEIR